MTIKNARNPSKYKFLQVLFSTEYMHVLVLYFSSKHNRMSSTKTILEVFLLRPAELLFFVSVTKYSNYRKSKN